MGQDLSDLRKRRWRAFRLSAGRGAVSIRKHPGPTGGDHSTGTDQSAHGRRDSAIPIPPSPVGQPPVPKDDWLSRGITDEMKKREFYRGARTYMKDFPRVSVKVGDTTIMLASIGTSFDSFRDRILSGEEAKWPKSWDLQAEYMTLPSEELPLSGAIEIVEAIESLAPGLLEKSGVKRIIFDERGKMLGANAGDYSSGNVRVVIGGRSRQQIFRTLLHELGHGLDDSMGGTNLFPGDRTGYWSYKNHPDALAEDLTPDDFVGSYAQEYKMRELERRFPGFNDHSELWYSTGKRTMPQVRVEFFADAVAYAYAPEANLPVHPIMVDYGERILEEAGLTVPSRAAVAHDPPPTLVEVLEGLTEDTFEEVPTDPAWFDTVAKAAPDLEGFRRLWDLYGADMPEGLTLGEQYEWLQAVAKRRIMGLTGGGPMDISKHPGPGQSDTHSTGSGQSVHGGGDGRSPITRQEYVEAMGDLGVEPLSDDEIRQGVFDAGMFGKYSASDPRSFGYNAEGYAKKKATSLLAGRRYEGFSAPAPTDPPEKEGQLSEPCGKCGREPSNMPLGLCDRCWPKAPVAKHPGPGSSDRHSTGTSQAAHGGGRSKYYTQAEFRSEFDAEVEGWETRLTDDGKTEYFVPPLECHRCGGSGKLLGYMHVLGGTCFRCGGNGVDPKRSFAEWQSESKITTRVKSRLRARSKTAQKIVDRQTAREEIVAETVPFLGLAIDDIKARGYISMKDVQRLEYITGEHVGQPVPEEVADQPGAVRSLGQVWDWVRHDDTPTTHERVLEMLAEGIEPSPTAMAEAITVMEHYRDTVPAEIATRDTWDENHPMSNTDRPWISEIDEKLVTALSSPDLQSQYTGIAAYAPQGYTNAQERIAEQAARQETASQSDYIGTIKDRKSFGRRLVTVEHWSAKTVPAYRGWGEDWRQTWIMRDEENNKIGFSTTGYSFEMPKTKGSRGYIEARPTQHEETTFRGITEKMTWVSGAKLKELVEEVFDVEKQLLTDLVTVNAEAVSITDHEHLNSPPEGPGPGSAPAEAEQGQGHRVAHGYPVDLQEVAKHPGPGDHPSGTPQSTHGRAARGLSGRQLDERIDETGGFTIHDPTGTLPISGYVVALAGHERTFAADQVTPRSIAAYRNRHAQALMRDDTYFGAWLDTETGKVYLDVTTVVDDLDEAMRLGRENDQLAIFNLNDFTEVRLDREGVSA